jgi:hypothetical protein
MILSLSAVSASDNDTVSAYDGDVVNTQDSNQELSSQSTADKVITSEKTQTNTNTTTDNSKSISKNSTNDNLKSESSHRTKISVSDRTGYITTNVQLIATVADKETNTYANGGLVVFKLNGITIGSSTLNNGKAYYTYNSKNLSAGFYTISATYGGYGKYASSKTSEYGLLELLPLPTKIATADVSAYQGMVTLKATVVDKYNSKYITNGTLLFKINGQTIATTNIKDGKAQLRYDASNLHAGKYTITAVYGANRIYSEYRDNGILTIKVQPTYTFDEVRNAAVYVRNHYEQNQIIKEVTVGSSKLQIQEYLYLVANALSNLYNNKASAKIYYKACEAPSTQIDTVKTFTLYESDVYSICTRLINYIDYNNKAPTYVSTSNGNLGYYNVIYCLSKVLDVSTKTYFVESCIVYPWSTLHPSKSTVRHIYLTSDNIYSKSTDMAFLNKIKAKLEAKGYTVTIVGIGPNTHNTKIWAKSMPINAAQLSIFGGSDAGMFYDMCTRSFMRTKSNRILYLAFNSATSKDFRNLSWLERAHDDNYSPSSFKGLANPSDYLLSHGYKYSFTNNVDTIVNEFIKAIS